MKILLIVAISLLVLLGVVFLIMSFSGPKKSDYMHLVTPRIIEKENVRSIAVDFDGDANKVLKEAFGKLFKKYYSLSDVPKWTKQQPPIARYENFDNNLELSQENIKDMPWKGFVSIPIGESVKAEEGNGAYIKNVEYGLVAELVHFGPYEEEVDNIKKLKDFIDLEGYIISGLHEEEYIKGPGFFYTSPKNYITIIRYQVKKK